MAVEFREIRDWITLVAAITAAAAPFIIHWRHAAQRRREGYMDWMLSTLPNETDPPGGTVVTVTYRGEVPLILRSARIVRPIGATIAKCKSKHPLKSSVLDVASDWDSELQLDTALTGDRRAASGSIVQSTESVRRLAVKLPSASLFRRSARISIRLTVEEMSANRRRHRVIVKSQEITLSARSTASAV